MTFRICTFFLIGFQISQAILIENILKENILSESFAEMYVPTLRAKSEICRNHSMFYLSELKKYKLWAAESKLLLDFLEYLKLDIFLYIHINFSIK